MLSFLQAEQSQGQITEPLVENLSHCLASSDLTHNYIIQTSLALLSFRVKPYKDQYQDSFTVAEYSWSIANNFVIGVYCRCLEILCQIAFSSTANDFRFYRKKVNWYRICRHLQQTPITKLLAIESLVVQSAMQCSERPIYPH